MAHFNIPLLVKQGLRLLNFPDSLVAQVFKAKYFPENNFLDSCLGNSCSYVWRSIWATKDTLKKGLIWKVGTGMNISITEDAWIPNYVNVRLMSRFNNLQGDKVADLINSNEREWNRELIVNTFPEDVADLILQIPLLLERHEDFLAWNGESSGEFSVRSSYKLLQGLDPTAYALQNIYRDFYIKLWRIEMPTKIKIFIWKISWNYLTNRVNMIIRRLATSSLCPRCGGGDETMNHLFRECPTSMEVWRVLSVLDLTMITYVEFGEWLTMAEPFVLHFGPLGGKEILEFMTKQVDQVRRLQDLSIAILKNLMELEKKFKKTSTVKIKWSHPPGQGVKINFDGAFDERSKYSASGVVVRDCSGQVLISSIEIHRGVASTFAAEAIACRRATQIALDMNKEYTIILGDSLTVIKKCKNTVLDKSQIGSIIHDIHRMKLRGN
ncbi:reverse transcriptase [Gossypium australe]|uniref:Reverse transcriptase n=1 Tax=Gossypium australe TaxID=47621 RepID=A0A5B6VCS5_9ROSI|nr:reverse transcriptase [Gossypium australe]